MLKPEDINLDELKSKVARLEFGAKEFKEQFLLMSTEISDLAEMDRSNLLWTYKTEIEECSRYVEIAYHIAMNCAMSLQQTIMYIGELSEQQGLSDKFK